MKNPTTDMQSPRKGRSLSTGTEDQPNCSFECLNKCMNQGCVRQEGLCFNTSGLVDPPPLNTGVPVPKCPCLTGHGGPWGAVAVASPWLWLQEGRVQACLGKVNGNIGLISYIDRFSHTT